jgi:uncharacterized protein YbjT (DUF2867 family)
MKVILFGATGMVGLGVLRECLLDAEVEVVQAVGRTALAGEHPRVRNVVHADLLHYESIEDQLTGFDACFFCLGVSAAGVAKAEYERVTYDVTLAAGTTLARLNPEMTFVYVSGQGTDSSEHGRMFWARVKGRTENALLRLPFKATYMFRPGFIEPVHGVRSKTAWYRAFYAILRPVTPLLRRVAPDLFLTTEQVGKAMLNVVRRGASKSILESRDIRSLVE